MDDDEDEMGDEADEVSEPLPPPPLVSFLALNVEAVETRTAVDVGCGECDEAEDDESDDGDGVVTTTNCLFV